MNDSPVDGRTLRFQHRRPELLDAVTEYVLDHGIGDLSLRPIAAAIGVTHSTLLRHFSSKEQLLLEVLQKIRFDFANQMVQDQEIQAAASTNDLLRLIWQRLCRPKDQRQFVVLFELIARTIRNSAPKEALAQAVLNDWVDMIQQSLENDGWPPDEAFTRASLILAQIRGLQIEALLTDDRKRVDHYFQLSLALFTQR